MANVNVKNGYLTIDIVNSDEYTLRSKRDDGVSVEMDMGYDRVAELRAMLWDAIRQQGRGFEFSVDDVLKIEEVKHKGRYSVEGYEEEINWTIDLLKRHLKRIEGWKETPAEDREVYGKLDEFLSQLEEPPRYGVETWQKADSRTESIHDAWEKGYATGHDVGFAKIATSDVPPE